MGGVDTARALHSLPGIFTLLLYPHWGVGRGGGRGPRVRAKTVTSDRDGGRLREEVFMCVCGRRRQGSLTEGGGGGGGRFNSKWTCEDGSAKSVCVCEEGSRAVLHRGA